ncbi:GxxExxY protein [Desulfuromonas carbonis]|uniref:GxxExxY protein n=1 Tax=Desulfuromonas sp. DDH964 TaxID=1823759 RepID=UPI00078CB8C8|nr:GxxExxY protein [Desulfuromonas sp. DDH964]AMV72882.1 hypothetical protein DBW_2554 [Desulfuromonas sp. DDH964]
MNLNTLSREVIGAALAVHRELGPGLLESVYQNCLLYELRERDLKAASEVGLPIHYRGQKVFESGLRIDLLVEDRLIVELKSVDKIQPVHFKQVLTYLRLANKPLGLLINFNEVLLKDGITRVAN